MMMMQTLSALSTGMRIGFGRQLTHLYDDLKALQPTFLVGHPEMFGRLHQHFQRIKRRWSWPYKRLFSWAAKRKGKLFATGTPQSDFWDWFLFRSISKSLGGNLKLIITYVSPDTITHCIIHPR